MNLDSSLILSRTRLAIRALVLLGAFCLGGVAALAQQSVMLLWDPSPDTNVVSYNIYYGAGTGNYTNVVSAGNATNATVTGLIPGVTYFFVATAVNSVGLESDPSNEISYWVPTGTNQPPTVNAITALIISENAAMQIVNVTGITSGLGDGPQPLSVTATSSAPSVVPDPSVTYSSPDSTATLTFTTVPNSFGEADVTVTVSDSILITQTVFHVTVNEVIPAATFPSPRGTFNGLFYESDEVRQNSSGSFAVTVTSSGAYSGRVQMGAKKYSFRGNFNAQGAGTNTVLRGLDLSLHVELQLGVGALTNRVTGRVTDGSWSANASGERSTYSAASNPCPQAGLYTIRLPGNAGSPPTLGDGFATLKISSAGIAKLAGALADGTKISLGATLASQLPVYVSLYKGQGALVSWFSVSNAASGSVDGLSSWTRPADPLAHFYSTGLTNETDVSGSAFHPPISMAPRIINLTNAVVSFSGGNLGLGFSNDVAISALGKVTNLSSNKLTLIFASGSGLFTGNVTDPSSGKILPFKGVLLQNANAGYGYLLGTNRSSAVLISSP